MKNVLVIGLGFIGYHVVKQLLKEGFSVTVLERNPSKDFFKIDYEIILGDVRDRNLISDVIMKFDGVINLAGILGTSETINNPFPLVDTNIIGALNVFEAIKSVDTKLVHITVGNHFMNNTYAITKSASERFALMYNREHRTKISVVRVLNAYGPYQKYKPVKKMIPNFILKSLKGLPIEIYGTGNQIMDLIYVEDVAKILVNALTIHHNNYESIFEAGTCRKLCVKEIANMINQRTGNRKGLKFLPMRHGEPLDSVVIGDPKTLYSLNIKEDDLVALEEGLEKTIEWYKGRIENFGNI